MMPRIFQLVACLLTSLIVTDAFLVSTDDKIHQMTTNTRLMAEIPSSTPETSRRELLLKATAVFGSAVLSNVVFPFMAVADADDSGIPMLTTDEFFIILRDSSKSIQRVEFSGPKAETVLVKLIDGTKFGLSDIIESSTDPRSPLKIQAACREYKVPFKNLQMEKFLATAPKKTKMYTNQRVQDAAAKTQERLERVARDEEERLAKLYEMGQEEAARK